MNPVFLSIADALKIHEFQITKYGGSLGVRDHGLLDSALNMPQSSFGNEWAHETIFLMAAAYLFHVSKNHPFVDGNKRTSLACALIFLDMNSYKLQADENALEKLVLDTATGKLSKDDIAAFFEKNSRKL